MTKGLPRSRSRGPATANPILKRIFTVENLPISMTSITTNPGTGTVVVGSLAEGNVFFIAGACYLTFSGSGADANLTDTWEGDFGIGQASITGDTLSGTEIDFIQETAIAAATAEVSPRTRGTNSHFASSGLPVDNTAGNIDLNLNVLIDAAHIGDGETVAMTVTGEIYISYIVLGDD